MSIRRIAVSAVFTAGIAALLNSPVQAQYYSYPCNAFPLTWPFCIAGAAVGTAATIATAPFQTYYYGYPYYYGQPYYAPTYYYPTTHHYVRHIHRKLVQHTQTATSVDAPKPEGVTPPAQAEQPPHTAAPQGGPPN